jgi:hypothetical protein
VVGPEGPGFEVGGGLKADLLDFSVRESFDVYILIAGQLSEFVVGRPRRSTVWFRRRITLSVEGVLPGLDHGI